MKNERYVPFLTSLWNDDWFLDLEPDEKLVWINLNHSDLTNDIGIFPSNRRIRAMQSSVSPERWDEIIEKFEWDGKIEVSSVTHEIAVNHYLIDHATQITPVSCPKLYREYWQIQDREFARKKMNENLDYYLESQDIRGKQNKSAKPSTLERFLDYTTGDRELTPDEKHDIFREKVERGEADPSSVKTTERFSTPVPKTSRLSTDDDYDFSHASNPFGEDL